MATEPAGGGTATTETGVAPVVVLTLEQKWTSRIKPFADSVGKTEKEITDALLGVVGIPSEDALETLCDREAAPDIDLKTVFTPLKIPSATLNKHLAKLRGPAKPKVATTSAVSNTTLALAILPALPNEESFIEMLKTGGVLKVGVTEVLSAVKASLARRVGLYDVTDAILAKMEEFANAQEQPCGEAFFRVQRMLTERRYGEVLSALGVPGTFVSERRKKEFFAKLDAHLWTAIASFQKQLTAWQQAWMQGSMNPTMLVYAITARESGSQMPPGMMAPPDTTPVRASGEAVIDTINRVFAGPGIPVARALAYDATRIMSVISDPEVPVQVGAATRDQMLKELGVNVGADIVRTEQSLTRYCLAIMTLKDIPADAELQYLTALIQLGSTIPWDKLVDARPAGLGRTRGSSAEE